MEIIVAECSATYSGRSESTLERGKRAVIIKDDGSVSIHNDSSNKPLNYMKTASQEESINDLGESVLTFDARHESLAVTFHHIFEHIGAKLMTKEEDPGVQISGTESHLQAYLFSNPAALGEGVKSIQREFLTGAGSVDLLCIAADGTPIAVEVKRVAILGAPDQVRRYVESMRTLENTKMTLPNGEEVYLDFSKTIGLVAALDLRPKMLELSEKRNLQTVLINREYFNEYHRKNKII